MDARLVVVDGDELDELDREDANLQDGPYSSQIETTMGMSELAIVYLSWDITHVQCELDQPIYRRTTNLLCFERRMHCYSAK